MDPRIQSLHRPLPIPKKEPLNQKPNVPFQQFLQEAKEIKVSKHAMERIRDRKIEISEQAWSKIGEKMTEANKKGVDQSLVVLNEATLVVSSKNRTVVTAMDRSETQSQIFTNINGTIFVNE
ncbi:TIGR02530 family flagellar biosynthesis protein [Halobacillus sp. SY10]|uniref:Flagellar operon protein n=1 Tax=Halobacillus aidingensis TaxID=240303 RepID=A0A1H0MUW8_HALAD|nr:TIGR02530 family flagellar biosynthesis protein [Halobacillus aidingensis]SDO84181.1 flagellar operon protein [Halobacillus aidingensis]